MIQGINLLFYKYTIQHDVLFKCLGMLQGNIPKTMALFIPNL